MTVNKAGDQGNPALNGGAFVLRPDHYPEGYAAYCVLLSVGLIAVCYTKGEPPRWRWGRGSD